MQNDLEHCWNELKPVVDELQRLILEAPLPDKTRHFLALRAVGHYLGTGCAMMQRADKNLQGQPLSVIGKQILDMVLPMLDQASNRLKN